MEWHTDGLENGFWEFAGDIRPLYAGFEINGLEALYGEIDLVSGTNMGWDYHLDPGDPGGTLDLAGAWTHQSNATGLAGGTDLATFFVEPTDIMVYLDMKIGNYKWAENSSGIRFSEATGQMDHTFSLTYIYDAAAIPEPSSWALALVGFGVLGSAMRRRRPSCALR